METTPTIGQRVTLENFDEIYMVKAVSNDDATVDLLTLGGKPYALMNVHISDLRPAESEASERSG